MENQLNKQKIWTEDVRVIMVERSELYSDPKIYQFGYYDGYHKAFEKIKTPEMLERLNQQNIDLKILKSNPLAEGYPEIVQKWIDENENLIKEATTI